MMFHEKNTLQRAWESSIHVPGTETLEVLLSAMPTAEAGWDDEILVMIVTPFHVSWRVKSHGKSHVKSHILMLKLLKCKCLA